jgi:hypothetical protein
VREDEAKRLLATWAWWQGPFGVLCAAGIAWFLLRSFRVWGIAEDVMALLSILFGALPVALLGNRLGKTGRGLVAIAPVALVWLGGFLLLVVRGSPRATEPPFLLSTSWFLQLSCSIGAFVGLVVVWKRDLNSLRRAGSQAPGL